MKDLKILIIIISTCLISCKKETNNPEIIKVESIDCRIKEIRDSANNELLVRIEYDPSGRISKWITPGEFGETYSEFIYSGNTLTIKSDYTIDGGSVSIETYNLNSDGYISGNTEAKPDTLNGNIGIRYDTTEYFYNNDNQLSIWKSRSWHKSISGNTLLGWKKVSHEFNSGRLTKVIRWDSLSQNRDSFMIYYYSDSSPMVKFNPFLGFLPKLFGKPTSNKIPFRSEEFLNGQIIKTTSNTFEINSDGYPTKIRSVRAYPGTVGLVIETKYYFYACP